MPNSQKGTNRMRKLIKLAAIVVIMIAPSVANAQSSTGSNTITTAVPFLTITPDSRAAAMGDAGVASNSDVNSQHWNAAKYAFINQQSGIGVSYSPWMRAMVDDMSLSYVSGFYKLDDKQALSASLRYFAMGSFVVRDEYNILQAEQNPNEFAFDFAYSRKLAKTFSGAVTMRYIRSNVASANIGNEVSSSANAFAVDIAFLYCSTDNVNSNAFSAGIVMSNIGSPISYDGGNTQDLLPANLRVGGGYSLVLNTENKFNFALDFNKLMVPSSHYRAVTDGDVIATGVEEDYSVIGGVYRSFSDTSFKEEMQEITTSMGVEYWYADQVALRTGYFNENKNKGGREYLTLGAGAKLYGLSFDIAYLYTFSNVSPLENTFRFSLALNLDTVF